MKKSYPFYTAILSILLLLSSCSNDDDQSEPPPKSTNLTLTIIDESGNEVSGAAVKLFASQTDWQNESNQVGDTKFTESNGVVSFTSLQSIQYFWFAEKDCRNNLYGNNTNGSSLESNTETTSTVVLDGTGSIELTSTSSNPYSIFLNGDFLFTMNGGTTRTIDDVSTGNQTVRVLQESGFVFTPTDQTYTVNLECGDLASIVFP